MELISVDYLTKLKEEFNYAILVYIRSVQAGGKELSTSLRDARKIASTTNNYTDIYKDKINDIIHIMEMIKQKKNNRQSYAKELCFLSIARL